MARDVRIRFKGDNEVGDAIRGVRRQLTDFGKSAREVLVGIGVGLGAGALGAFFKSAVEEAGKAALANQQLGQAVRNLGLDYEALRPQLEAAVTATQRLSTQTDDDLTAALTTLISISGNVRGSLQNLTLTADLAAAKHIQLEQAAQLVGKAMAGETSTLKRYGIVVAEGGDAIEVMRQRFAGFAAGEAKTLGGQLKVLTNQWGEVQEAVGRAIAGTDQAGQPVSRLTQLLIDLEGWIVRNETALTRLSTLLTGTVATAFRVGLIAPINVVITAMEGLGALADTLAVGFLQLAQRLQGIFGSVLRTAGTAFEAAGLTAFGQTLAATGDAIVLEAAQEHARLRLRLDEALNARYNRTSGRSGAVFNATPTGNGPPGVGDPATVDERVKLIATRIQGNRETAADRAELARFLAETQAALERQRLTVEQRLALEQRLSQILAARQALAERNVGPAAGAPGNQVPGGEGTPGGEVALVEAAQQAAVPDLLQGQRPEGLPAAEGTPAGSFAEAFDAALAAVEAFNAEVRTSNQLLGELAGAALLGVADGVAALAASIGAGAPAFGLLAKAARQAVADIAKAEGQLAIRQGAVKIAKAIFPPNPAELASGLKMIAAGTLLSALGGAASGGGGQAGGGGGLSPAAFPRDQAESRDSRRGRGVVIVKDGVLHTRSPEFRDLITSIVEEAAELGEFELQVED
jgi:hypothetical protein